MTTEPAGRGAGPAGRGRAGRPPCPSGDSPRTRGPMVSGRRRARASRGGAARRPSMVDLSGSCGAGPQGSRGRPGARAWIWAASGTYPSQTGGDDPRPEFCQELGGLSSIGIGKATIHVPTSVPGEELGPRRSSPSRRWPWARSDRRRALPASPPARADQAEAEAHALAVPTPEKARSWLHTLTEEPHVAGTPADHKTALFVRDKLREWGWKADLAEYEVLLNYPQTLGPARDRPAAGPPPRRSIEDPIAADKDSASPDAFPAFHGYGVSGDVTGQVVYANYGRVEDFEALEKKGIEVEGKIVLVRYGEVFRGLKVRNAQKRKAKGMLIYSDPADDGYAKGDIYPDGPYRPGSAIQRGSVQFLSLGPGDPSTPLARRSRGRSELPIDPLPRIHARGRSVRDCRGSLTPASVGESKSGRRRRGWTATTTSPASLRCRSAMTRPGRSWKPWAGRTSRRGGKGGCRWPTTSGRGRSRSTSGSRWITRSGRSGT